MPNPRSEVARITSPICGICSVGPALASLKATEDALGIPDHSAISQATHHSQARREFRLPCGACALRLKRFGHEFGSIFAGRTTHPTNVKRRNQYGFPEEIVIASSGTESTPELEGKTGYAYQEIR